MQFNHSQEFLKVNDFHFTFTFLFIIFPCLCSSEWLTQADKSWLPLKVISQGPLFILTPSSRALILI